MILTHLDLSTGHIKQETMETLTFISEGKMPTGQLLEAGAILQQLGWPAMTIAAYDRGCFVSCPDECGAGLPHDLLAVVRHAQRYGATVIRFDADGTTLEALPIYDW
jgi:hypothetical protein